MSDHVFLWLDPPALAKPGRRREEMRYRYLAPSDLGIRVDRPGWRRAGESEVVYLRLDIRDPMLRREFLARAIGLDDLSTDSPATTTSVVYAHIWPWTQRPVPGNFWLLAPETSVAGPVARYLWTDKSGAVVPKGDAFGRPRETFPVAKDSDRIGKGMSGAPITLKGGSRPLVVGILFGNVYDGDPSDRDSKRLFALVAPVAELRAALENLRR